MKARLLLPLLLLPGVAARGEVTYQEVVRPIFQNSCLNCHNADKHKAGLDLSTYDATMDGSDNGKVVETGNAEKSLLLKVLTHDEEPFMPKGADKLPDSQIATIKQWIQANAPEKVGGAVAKRDAGPAVSTVAVEEKPKGPPAMPKDGLLEPVVRTIRTGAVPSVAGSPWAPLVALAAQKQVLLYNTDTLELAAVLPFPEGFPEIVRFSHNGSLVIAGGGIGAKLGHVVIWDVVTGKRVTVVGDEFDTVLAADISPDHSLIALGGPSRLVKIFSTSDGKMVAKMKKHTDWVTALSFTPDGKELISGDRAGGLSIWDCQGHEVQSVSAHTGAITAIACRGNIVATSSEDGTVKFWDTNEGKELKSWHAHDYGARSVAFTQDGHLVTCGRDRMVRLWDVNGRQVQQFGPLSDIAMQAAGAGGKIIAADWKGVVRMWTPDGRHAGDVDSNPPTIAQRIDATNRALADLQPREAQAEQALTQTGNALTAARKRVADGIGALTAKKAAQAATQASIGPLEQQIAAATAAIQKARQDSGKLEPLAKQFGCAALVEPALLPGVMPVVASYAKAAQTMAEGNAALVRSKAADAAAHQQAIALTHDIEAMGHANIDAAAGEKSAETARNAARTAADRLAAQSKAANIDLLKWRAAAARLTSNPQLVSSKNVDSQIK